MGFISNMLVEKTEKVLGELNVADPNDEIFDKIQDFIMDNGDMLYDSPSVIADAYTKSIKQF